MLTAIALIAGVVCIALAIVAVIAHARRSALAPRLHVVATCIAAALSVLYAVRGEWLAAGIWLFNTGMAANNFRITRRSPRRSA
ncbi:MAG TPA: hypothetical protein VIQ30_23465 [Pseudonocardia sp.]